jgi:uroporphyrinogen decarboxylase
MRQAGRYMQEYRDLRARHSFLDLCKQPDLAAEVTLHAREVLQVDAAILFADILLIVECLGLKLTFQKGDGPVIEPPVRTPEEARKLLKPEVEQLNYVYEAVRLIRRDLPQEISLIGFAGAPFTVASYCIEGGSSREFLHTKRLMHSDPEAWHTLMTLLAEATILYLKAQIEAGADSIQLFDSWAGCLSPADYRKYVKPYSSQVLKSLPADVPKIHFGRGSALLLQDMAECGADVVGVDYMTPMDWARQQLGPDRPVQGNFDPALLLTEPALIRAHAQRIMREAGPQGHIFNLGHGIVPQTPVDNVKYLVEVVHQGV